MLKKLLYKIKNPFGASPTSPLNKDYLECKKYFIDVKHFKNLTSRFDIKAYLIWEEHLNDLKNLRAVFYLLLLIGCLVVSIQVIRIYLFFQNN